MRRILLAVMLVLLLAGCCGSTINGYVVGKEFIQKHNRMEYNVIFKRMMPKHYPDTWYVWVADSCCVHHFSVDQGTFDRLRKGDYVTSDKLCHGQE